MNELVHELAALRARLADNERWAQEFKARYEQERAKRAMAEEQCDLQRDRLRTLEERARAVEPLLIQVLDGEPFCRDCSRHPVDCTDSCKRRRLADALGEKV